MKSIEMPGQIEYIGEAAHGLLTSQLRGKILAVVSHAAYLLNENGEVFWLAMKNIPMHRRGIRLSAPFPQLTVGTPFEISAHHLILGPETSLDFSQAPVWVTPPLNSHGVLPVADLPLQLRTFPAIPADLPAPAGFGSLIPGILLIAQGQSAAPPNQISEGIPAHAWPAVREIARACLVHDFPKIMQQSCSLAGLGEGLTPSGDDFIGGLLFCIKILQASYADVPNLEFTQVADFIESMRDSTNIISFTFLEDLAEGYGIDTLHQFAEAFLNGQPASQLRQVVSELIHIGHSTGWDLLTDFLTGMLLAS